MEVWFGVVCLKLKWTKIGLLNENICECQGNLDIDVDLPLTHEKFYFLPNFYARLALCLTICFIAKTV